MRGGGDGGGGQRAPLAFDGSVDGARFSGSGDVIVSNSTGRVLDAAVFAIETTEGGRKHAVRVSPIARLIATPGLSGNSQKLTYQSPSRSAADRLQGNRTVYLYWTTVRQSFPVVDPVSGCWADMDWGDHAPIASDVNRVKLTGLFRDTTRYDIKAVDESCCASYDYERNATLAPLQQSAQTPDGRFTCVTRPRPPPPRPARPSPPAAPLKSLAAPPLLSDALRGPGPAPLPSLAPPPLLSDALRGPALPPPTPTPFFAPTPGYGYGASPAPDSKNPVSVKGLSQASGAPPLAPNRAPPPRPQPARPPAPTRAPPPRPQQQPGAAPFAPAAPEAPFAPPQRPGPPPVAPVAPMAPLPPTRLGPAAASTRPLTPAKTRPVAARAPSPTELEDRLDACLDAADEDSEGDRSCRKQCQEGAALASTPMQRIGLANVCNRFRRGGGGTLAPPRPPRLHVHFKTPSLHRF